MEDRELERLAQQLGKTAAEKIDAERVAAQVVGRLRRETEPHRSKPWYMHQRTRRIMKIAAVLTVLVTGGLFLRNSGDPAGVNTEFAVPMALDDLSESELTVVLDSLEFAGPIRQVGRGGIDDLSDAELEELLLMME